MDLCAHTVYNTLTTLSLAIYSYIYLLFLLSFLLSFHRHHRRRLACEAFQNKFPFFPFPFLVIILCMVLFFK